MIIAKHPPFTFLFLVTIDTIPIASSKSATNMPATSSVVLLLEIVTAQDWKPIKATNTIDIIPVTNLQILIV